jgi:hypothetical protein
MNHKFSYFGRELVVENNEPEEKGRYYWTWRIPPAIIALYFIVRFISENYA